MKLKIKKATDESSEGNKVSMIQGAITRLKKQLLQMDQKREILSWQLRRQIGNDKNKGKDDYLQISYFDEL